VKVVERRKSGLFGLFVFTSVVATAWLLMSNAHSSFLPVFGGARIQDIALLFERMDADSSGELCLNEVRLMLQQLNRYKDEDTLRNLFLTMDANRNGTIDFDEAEQHEETERDLQLAVEKFEQSISHQELFLKMDTDGSGYLCRDELRRVLKKEGDYQDEQGLLQLFKKMDSNGDDAISFHEADDYESKDATNSVISPYLDTVANLLAKTKGAANASGINASFAGDGLNVSYYRESLSQLLTAATSTTGNDSASYLESLSSLLAAYSSSCKTANSSAASSHNASYYGESWSRLVVGVFSSASNATNLTANDSASYLESLSSLLVAYSPGSLTSTSNTPVPKKTEGTGAAWLASVGSLLSLVSSGNASGTDAPA
jgi:Ca2+-binding EF-hand superfamily protein